MKGKWSLRLYVEKLKECAVRYKGNLLHNKEEDCSITISKPVWPHVHMKDTADQDTIENGTNELSNDPSRITNKVQNGTVADPIHLIEERSRVASVCIRILEPMSRWGRGTSFDHGRNLGLNSNVLW